MAPEHKYDRHEEETTDVAAEPDAVFDFLDDHAWCGRQSTGPRHRI
jgi:hypothetical protein